MLMMKSSKRRYNSSLGRQVKVMNGQHEEMNVEHRTLNVQHRIEKMNFKYRMSDMNLIREHPCLKKRNSYTI